MRAPVSFLISASLGLFAAAQTPLASAAGADPSSPIGTVKAVPVCAQPESPDAASCAALRLVNPIGKANRLPVVGAPVSPGLAPADLRSAYDIPENAGGGTTIAVVAGLDYPTAEADLDVYRKQFGLPALAPGQFKKVNQRGAESDYPMSDEDWATETALELDMVSAVAPRANILLVEADSPNFEDLGASVNTAVALGATVVNNGYYTKPESAQQLTFGEEFYDHPGVAVVAPAGDLGVGTTFPASAPHVVAVGGTSLVKAPGTPRGWSESVWTDVGVAGASGCSTVQPKPAFQKDTGCAGRTVADVSAVADPVAVYDSYGAVNNQGWTSYTGTTVSASVIAGMYAAAGPLDKNSEPNSLPYADTADLHDVTTGSNGTCDPQYLCTAEAGYDGPTGLGTPAGTGAFSAGPSGQLTGTVTDASTGAPVAGAQVSLGGGTTYTDDKGVYFLNARPGDHDVSVTGFGYQSHTVPVTVTADTSATVDTTLTAEATTTLSGKVNDASGHGYPLSAQVDIVGHPAAVSHTDPVTGRYSLKVPANGTYDVRVTAQYPGYLPQEAGVTVGSSATTHNFGVQADPRALNGLAAGYTQQRTGDTQTFESGSVPDGWTVTGTAGTPQWAVTDNCPVPAAPWGGSGRCLMVSADRGVDAQTDLTSPELPLPAGQDALLTFDTDARYDTYVSFSTDGGTTWHTAWAVPWLWEEWGHQAVALPVDGASSVRVRFRFVAKNSGGERYAELDNIRVGGARLDPQPGGLVVGTVTDANTRKALDGAAVSTDGGGAPRTLTASIPGFGSQNDGYWFFAPAGGTTVTAQLPHYAVGTGRLKVAADRANRQDFALGAGRIEVSGTADVTVPSGQSAVRTVTVRNTGTAPAKVALSEHPGAPARGWVHGADLPEAMTNPIAAAPGGVLYAGLGYDAASGQESSHLFAFDAGSGSWKRKSDALVGVEAAVSGTIDGKVYVSGGLNSSFETSDTTQVYDPATDSWSAGATDPDPRLLAGGAVLDGKLYTVGGATDVWQVEDLRSPTVSVYDPVGDSWRRVHDYPLSVSQLACAGIAGKLYCAGGYDGTGYISDTYAYDPGKDTWTKVADAPVPLGHGAYSEADGTLVVTSEGSNTAAFAVYSYAYNPACDCWKQLPTPGGGHFSGAGALGYVLGGWDTGLQPSRRVELLPGLDQPDADSVPWLSEDPAVTQLAPGASVKVQVRMDAGSATISGPGPVNANLSFDTDTPYAAADLPVTMTVTSP